MTDIWDNFLNLYVTKAVYWRLIYCTRIIRTSEVFVICLVVADKRLCSSGLRAAAGPAGEPRPPAGPEAYLTPVGLVDVQYGCRVVIVTIPGVNGAANGSTGFTAVTSVCWSFRASTERSRGVSEEITCYLSPLSLSVM